MRAGTETGPYGMGEGGERSEVGGDNGMKTPSVLLALDSSPPLRGSLFNVPLIIPVFTPEKSMFVCN